MMKRVGICTCYDTYNYGSMLQSLATQVIIEKLGYDNEFIVYKKKKNIFFVLKQIPRLLNKHLVYEKMLQIRKCTELIKNPEAYKNNQLRKKRFQEFQKKYYKNFSDVYYGYKELCNASNEYSTVIVGSDQLWSPAGLPTNFYSLMFVPDSVNKVSYATSFGVSSIPWYQKKRTTAFLQRINYLSVRENQGAKIVEELSGRKAKVVLDPTMLLTKEDWQKIIPDNRIISDDYIFCYFLGEKSTHRNIAEKVSKRLGIKIVTIPFLDTFVETDKSFGDIKLYDVGPDGFVNLIRNASYIITDSFHGSVFSIIHHKKFVTLNRYSVGKNSRNARIESLMKLLGVKDRHILQLDNIYDSLVAQINYVDVDQKIDSIRNDSLVFLKTALSASEGVSR